jgi:hypothetical protein
MKLFKKTLIPAAVAGVLALASATASAVDWRLNYADSVAALGGGAATVNPVSNLTDEYKYTAESLVLFNDLDGSGNISPGDTFLDLVLYRIDQLFLGGGTNSDLDTFLKNAQVSGVVIASGVQVTPNDYLVTSANIGFWFDSIGTPPVAPGTDANFNNPNAFVDGILVQTGTGSGAGTNAGLIPDGAINITFQLTDILSTLGEGEFGNFELFDRFIPLDQITFSTDSNNQACPPALCNSTVAALEAFFDVSTADFDFFFHTRSDGSATKAVPEPGTLALLGATLLGLGALRRRQATMRS